MACSNCFNGCADTVSDQCVKYTGVDIPGLGIETGDPLLVVENQITAKILELMTGAGIIPVINSGDLCSLVSSFLPVSGPITLNNVISALFRSICALDTRLVAAEGKLTALNADYVIPCLTGVTQSSDTHEILQATINQLCSVTGDLQTLAAEVFANYVLIADINSYIASYLASIPVSTLYNTRMVPYTIVPYYGVTTGFFDITGAGIGQWAKIYLCNGQNLTPDLRGRVLVGATTMGNTAFSPVVDPAIPGNPTYALGDTAGTNQAFLTSPAQLPPHTHGATVRIEDPGHNHTFTVNGPYINGVNCSGNCNGVNDFTTAFNTSTNMTNLKGTGVGQNVFVDIGSTGSSAGHNNIQPVQAVNYIMYIP